jgi:hypothetical protein
VPDVQQSPSHRGTGPDEPTRLPGRTIVPHGAQGADVQQPVISWISSHPAKQSWLTDEEAPDSLKGGERQVFWPRQRLAVATVKPPDDPEDLDGGIG